MNSIAASIVALNQKLLGAPFDFAFLGGSVLSLLVNDPTADTIRVTMDVDIIADVRTRADFHREERELESRGFSHDTREGAPVCRWVSDGIVVDVLPIRQEVLGWNSTWFEEALRAAKVIEIEGHPVKVISAPFFVALKLEAFEERGMGDFIGSTDFEDVICLFNGRRTIVDEILSEPAICAGITERFARYIKIPDLEDAVMGFVQTESDPERRYADIMGAFRLLADFSHQ